MFLLFSEAIGFFLLLATGDLLSTFMSLSDGEQNQNHSYITSYPSKREFFVLFALPSLFFFLFLHGHHREDRTKEERTRKEKFSRITINENNRFSP
jgi:hypothetical protein